MKSLVLYDSQFGNTEKIAQAIARGMGSATAIPVHKARLQNLKNISRLIVGSPTQGGRPTLPLQQFLDNLPAQSLIGVNVGAFDTRFDPTKVNLGLKLLMSIIGFAAPKIAKTLTHKGGKLLLAPEGFIVKGKDGPLATGELERAATWIKGDRIK